MLETIRKIIVPTDFSERSEAALRSATELAKQDEASIHLLHTIRFPVLHTNYDVNIPEAIWEGIRKGVREQMDESRRSLEAAGVAEVGTIVLETHQPAEAVAKSALEIDADLVVMATHGRRGIKHAFLGSLTERTIRTCPIPVLAVKDGGISDVPLHRILLPVDFSTHSQRATTLAISLARRWNAVIDVLHVRDNVPDYMAYASAAAIEFDKDMLVLAAEKLEAIATTIREKEVSATTHLPEGIAPIQIAETAGELESDLIVMGTHGLTGLSHAVIGSVTERTLRLAHCPVLTTKAASEASG